MFLTSQLGYLRGVDCDESEVRFLCQEHFDAGWQALLDAFDVDAHSAPIGHKHRRSAAAAASRGAIARAAGRKPSRKAARTSSERSRQCSSEYSEPELSESSCSSSGGT